VLDAPWVAGYTVEAEFRGIRNGVFHYGHDNGGNAELAAGMRLAAREAGSLRLGEKAGPSSAYTEKVARQR
jgi:hypothetical protein